MAAWNRLADIFEDNQNSRVVALSNVEKILWIVQEAKSTPTKFIGCLWEIPLGTLKRNC
jgi:hypothetical protein